MKGYDVLGRQIFTQQLSARKIRAVISIKQFANGLYLLGFYAKDGQLIQSNKFIR